MIDSPVPAQAKCALHPDRTAHDTCPRCGNFRCGECTARPVCPTCWEITGSGGFPFTRETWTFGGSFSYAFERFKAEWLMLSLTVLLVFLVSGAGSFVSAFLNPLGAAIADEPGRVAGMLLGQIIANVFAGVATLGGCRVAIDVLHGEKADPLRLFSQLRKVGRYLLQVIVVIFAFLAFAIVWAALTGMIAVATATAPVPSPLDGLAAFFDAVAESAPVALAIATAILLVPFAWFVVPTYFGYVELALNDRIGGVAALRNAFAVLRGHRLIALVMLIVALGLTFAGLVACIVGILPAVAFVLLMYSALYVGLRNGADLPIPDEPRDVAPPARADAFR